MGVSAWTAAAFWEVRVADFEGTLDSLLLLVREAKVDVGTLSVAEIARQYLAYLHGLPEPDLAAGGDLLYQVSTLLRWKVRALLPRREGPEEADEAGEEEDPRAALAAVWAEYRLYREAGRELEARRQRREAHLAPAVPPVETEEAPVLPWPAGSLAPSLLARALVELFRARTPAPAPPLPADRLPVRRGLRRILAGLKGTGGVLAFERLFDPSASRLEWIATFLALLELILRGRVRAVQEEPYGPIEIRFASPRQARRGP